MSTRAISGSSTLASVKIRERRGTIKTITRSETRIEPVTTTIGYSIAERTRLRNSWERFRCRNTHAQCGCKVARKEQNILKLYLLKETNIRKSARFRLLFDFHGLQLLREYMRKHFTATIGSKNTLHQNPRSIVRSIGVGSELLFFHKYILENAI